jgi:hypothetical protein
MPKPRSSSADWSGLPAACGEPYLEFRPFCPVCAVAWWRYDRVDVAEIRLQPAQSHIDPVDRAASAGAPGPRLGACRTGSFLGAKYRRLNKRMPRRKALVATGNSVLTIYRALLSDPAATYRDLGPDHHDQCAGARR